ncbi:DnaD domain-containing protein [Lactococcus lactis]|uniref:DnaD domain-containing protein n=1 Tax=Lactococcus lactis TaxID=1358 RepID=UPI00288EE848|nr:DnaD domain protein [Lactococcus lactis]MDT2898647.1 DnaD domain protein [Lactococcus lactis]MDT2949036.1 DnaD domain protein [Lactococcus lactis]
MSKRIIETSFWTDEKVIDNYSPEDKYFMLYLLTNPKTTAIGIYPLPIKIIAFDIGYSKESVLTLIERFDKTYKNIVYDAKTQEIAVLNSLKYTISKGGKPVEDMINRELNAVKNSDLIESVYKNMLDWWSISDRKFDELIKSSFEKEISKRKEAKEKNTNVNADANANANTDSVDDSYHDSLKPHNSSKYDTFNFSNESYSESPNESSNEKNDFQYLIALYQENFGIVKPILYDDLKADLKDYGLELIIEAVKRAVKRQREYAYAQGILKSWNRSGIKTLEQAKAEEVSFQNKSQNNQNKFQQQKPVKKAPEWTDEGRLIKAGVDTTGMTQNEMYKLVGEMGLRNG